MDKSQENFMSMVLSAQKTLLDAQLLWAADTILSNNISILGNFITQINTQVQIQLLTGTGLAKNKKAARLALVDWIITVSAALQSYASETSNNDLYDKAKVTKTKLETIRDTIFSNIAKEISDLATSNLSALGNFDINSDSITIGSTLKSSYDALISAPKVAKSAQKTATETIADLISQLKIHFSTKLDKNIVRYKTNKLFSDYHNARHIDKTGIRHKKDETIPVIKPNTTT